MPHLRPLGASAMVVARNRTISSPASQANSIDDVVMRRRISPFAPMLQLMLVLVDWCTARLVLRAVSGVRFEFMHRSFSNPSHQFHTYSNSGATLL